MVKQHIPIKDKESKVQFMIENVGGDYELETMDIKHITDLLLPSIDFTMIESCLDKNYFESLIDAETRLSQGYHAIVECFKNKAATIKRKGYGEIMIKEFMLTSNSFEEIAEACDKNIKDLKSIQKSGLVDLIEEWLNNPQSDIYIKNPSEEKGEESSELKKTSAREQEGWVGWIANMHYEEIKTGKNKGKFMVCDDANGMCKIIDAAGIERLKKNAESMKDWHH